MKFSVVKKKTYGLEDAELIKFKEKMLEYFNSEKGAEGVAYTCDDIPDDIVKGSLAETVQVSFNEIGEFDCFYGGVHFNDFNSTIELDYDEDDVMDCVYEAVEKWILLCDT